MRVVGALHNNYNCGLSQKQMKCQKCGHVSKEDKKQAEDVKELLSAIASQDKQKAEELAEKMKPMWWSD